MRCSPEGESGKAVCSPQYSADALYAQHEAGALECSPTLQRSLEAAVTAQHASLTPAPRLVSGAGHDGLALASLCPVGMVFVRCRGGVSHSPLEFVSKEDVAAVVAALLHVLRNDS